MTKYRRAGALNRYYKITKFYTFLKDTAIKGGRIIIVFIVALLFFEYFIIDIDSLLNTLVKNYSPKIILLAFMISETLLGLLPPEIFIAWSAKSSAPWTNLFLLATISYLGGVLAYGTGKLLFLIPSVKNYLEHKVDKHISNLRKWGGLFVLVGAMLPIPHAFVSMASGLIKYRFRNYLLWALFRYMRFAIYGLIIFQVF